MARLTEKLVQWFPVLAGALRTNGGSLWVPLCFFVIGFCLGGFHIGYYNVVMESLVLFSILVALSSFGTQWGAYLFVGLVLGDFLIFRLAYIFQSQSNQYYYSSIISKAIRMSEVGIPTLIYYYLLAMVCYRIPVFCRDVSRQAAIRVGLSGILIYFWTLAYPVLIRPIWTWAHSVPPVSAIAPIQWRGGWVVLAVVVAGVAREWWQKRTGQCVNDGGVDVEAGRISILPKRVLLFVKPAVGTFLVSGLLTTWWDTLLLFGILFLFNLVRSGDYIRFPKVWIRLVGSIPLWARLLMGLALSWYFAAKIHEEMWRIGSTALFLPLIVSFGVSLLIMFFLFPPGIMPAKEKI